MGGLGLRKAVDFNNALLSKLSWHMEINSNKMWVQVMHEKYVKEGDFFKAPVASTTSWGWKSIMQGREVIEGVVRWRVGDGCNINMWYDQWVGEATLDHKQDPEVVEELSNCTVSKFILNNRTWDMVKLGEILPANKVDAIRVISIPVNKRANDKLVWSKSTKGTFSVSSTFNVIVGLDDNVEDWS